MTNHSRRNMLRQLTCGGLMMALPASALARPAGDVSLPLAARLSRLFSNGESARVIGQRYLDLTPGEANLDRLMVLICRCEENYARLARADSEQLLAILQEQQRLDFAHARTVAIDGWILSETEVRLCAVAAII